MVIDLTKNKHSIQQIHSLFSCRIFNGRNPCAEIFWPFKASAEFLSTSAFAYGLGCAVQAAAVASLGVLLGHLKVHDSPEGEGKIDQKKPAVFCWFLSIKPYSCIMKDGAMLVFEFFFVALYEEMEMR